VWTHASFRWYGELAQSQDIIRSLKNSLIVAAVSTIVSTVIGTAAALSMERFRYRGQRTYDALLYLPIIIPDVTMAVMMLLFFVQAFGILNGAFGTRIELGLGSISLAHIAFNISFVAVVVRARLAQMDSSLEEAARDLYASRWQTFRKVTLPLIMPGVAGGARRRGGHQLRDGSRVDDTARIRVRPGEEGCDAAGQCRIDAHAGSVDVVGRRLALFPEEQIDQSWRRDC